jgi:uncharacterized membrane protein
MNIIYSMFALFTLACFALAQQAPESVSIRVITTFDYPGKGNLTLPQEINDAGDIVGYYIDFFSNLEDRGFVRFANGNFSAPIVEPNDTCMATRARGINNSRLVCGEYYSGADCTAHGFFLKGNNFSEFDLPGSVDTFLFGVNNVADFCGGFTDGSGTQQAFVSLGGTITTFSVPGATGTSASDLNSSNQVVGSYTDSSGTTHGYFRNANGTLRFPIDPPGATLTGLRGNNDSNWIVGDFTDSGGTTHGLFFVPPNRFFSFDYPGSSFTTFTGINAQGFICGYYNDDSGIHGFLARVRGVPTANETGKE